jgi:transketolase
MPLIDSRTGKIQPPLEGQSLARAARLMRAQSLVAIHLAGSGHSGGTLSVMDIAAALYLNVLRHDPSLPNWPDRDRVVWSAGHKAPALYIALGASGYYDVNDVATLRKLGSPFQGHPHHKALPGIEFSTGSLGQGLSLAVGQALARRYNGRDYRVFCIMGDGEHQEGQVWEAVMEAGHFRLGGLVAVVDVNGLQIDGRVGEVMEVQPLAAKYRAFGWEAIECDGHDLDALVKALATAASTTDKPVAVLARTVKGKGVDFMEDQVGWHGKSPNAEELAKALTQINADGALDLAGMTQRATRHQERVTAELRETVPRFKRDYFWNRGTTMAVDMEATRLGFGRALNQRGDDERVVCLGEDISGSIAISDFYRDHPERRARFISIGIAEQSATGVAAGLAKEGLLPVLGSYGVFAAGRALDQLRTTVCYGGFNVLVAGAHGGISVGPDGATHQALEDLFQVCGLPNMTVVVPCDARETQRATETLLFEVKGPKFLRFAREATPVVTTDKTPFVFGKANVIRFRQEAKRFVDAFETRLASDYVNEREELALIACGPMVPEAMRAAWMLKTEFGIESRVVNLHTLKPLDADAIARAARETGAIVTVEEHQAGGLGHRVLAAIAEQGCDRYVADLIGVNDRFGESGGSWELMFRFGLSAEHIAARAHALWLRRTAPTSMAQVGKEV